MESLFSEEPTLKPQIFDQYQIAEILGIEVEQVYRWIADDEVPYIALPEPGEFRLPFQGVLCMLDYAIDMKTGESFMKPARDMLRECSERSDITED